MNGHKIRALRAPSLTSLSHHTIILLFCHRNLFLNCIFLLSLWSLRNLWWLNDCRVFIKWACSCCSWSFHSSLLVLCRLFFLLLSNRSFLSSLTKFHIALPLIFVLSRVIGLRSLLGWIWCLTFRWSLWVSTFWVLIGFNLYLLLLQTCLSLHLTLWVSFWKLYTWLPFWFLRNLWIYLLEAVFWHVD